MISSVIPHEGESWIARNWRPLCGIVYLLICLSDFLVLPWYHTILHGRYTPEKVFEIARQVEGGAQQIEAMRVLRAQEAYEPVTLGGSGLFHIAFGAILGVAAWTRGSERIERVKGDAAVQTEQARTGGMTR
jgi:hypothetical protein